MKPNVIIYISLFILVSCSEDDSEPSIIEDFAVLNGTWTGWSANDINPEDTVFISLDLDFTEEGRFTMVGGRIVDSESTLELNEEITGRLGSGRSASMTRRYQVDCGSGSIEHEVEFIGSIFDNEDEFRMRFFQTFQHCPDVDLNMSTLSITHPK